MNTFDSYLLEDAPQGWNRQTSGRDRMLYYGDTNKRLFSPMIHSNQYTYDAWRKGNSSRWIGLKSPTKSDFEWLMGDDTPLLAALKDSDGNPLDFKQTPQGMILKGQSNFNSKFDAETYPWLEQITEVHESMVLDGIEGMRDLKCLSNITRFAGLTLKRCEDLESLDGLENCKRIWYLHIHRCPNLKNIHAIVHDWDGFELAFNASNDDVIISRFRDDLMALQRRDISIQINDEDLHL